jgi:hypothetical protein
MLLYPVFLVCDCSLALVCVVFWRLSYRRSRAQIAGFIDRQNLTNGFFTYHGLWTITSSSRIISKSYLDIYSALFTRCDAEEQGFFSRLGKNTGR